MNSFLIKILIVFKTIISIKNWHVPIMHYLSNAKEDVVVFKNGTKCIIRDKSDVTAFFETFFLKSYTNMKDFIIKENDVIIDIGAHVGYFTIYAAKCAPKGKLYAFEPTPNSFKVLQNNIKLNKLENVIAENYGVLKNSGSAILFIDKNHEIGNSMFKNNAGKEEKIVNTMSLQDIFDKYQIKIVDLLKIDCEGAEFEIILNLSKNILQKIIKISAEIHTDIQSYTIEDLIKFLTANNFKVECKYLLSTSKPYWPMLYAINRDYL